MKENKYDISKEDIINLYQKGLCAKEVSQALGVSYWVLLNRQKIYGIHSNDYLDIRSKYNVHVFDEIDTEDKSYWAGFIFADGSVRSSNRDNSVSVELNSIDYGHLLKLKTFFEDKRPDSTIWFRERITDISKKKQILCTYQVCNKFIKTALINIGCPPRKSNILKFPDLSIFKEEHLVYDFIRGYIDGDGCLYSNSTKRGDRLAISIRGTLEFLTGIFNIFPQLKIYKEIDKKTGHTLYRSECYGNKADEVAYKLYENANTYLDRKYEKYATLCRLHNSETSDKIGESCDANAEVTPEIAKGPESTVENSE